MVPAGLLLADKGPGVTSFHVVAHVRRVLRVAKVGHGGTLDPMATGILPLLLGDATKLTPYLLGQDKEYVATVRLGLATDTLDATGRVTAERPVPPLTPAAVFCSVLLGGGKRALAESELLDEMARTIDYARERGIPMTREVAAGAESILESAAALASTGVVERYAAGTEPVHHVTEKGRHAASYYRNTVIHFVLARAITELANTAAPRRGTSAAGARRNPTRNPAARLFDTLLM